MTATRALEVEVVAAVFLTLSWTTAILRCYVRAFKGRGLGADDWLAILALMLFTTTTIFTFLGIKNSMGMHLFDILATAPQNMTPTMMWWFANELGYVVTSCAMKMSVVVFLLRIVVEDSHRVILHLTMAMVVVSAIAYFFFLLFQCSPVDYFWLQFSMKKGSCVAPDLVGGMTYAHSAVNALADIILAFLPVVIVLRLQMSLRTKLTVSIILSMGMFACVAVIVRIPYIKILVDDSQDFLYSSIDVIIWSAIELGLAITAANMATLRPLFSPCLGRQKFWAPTSPRGKFPSCSSAGEGGSAGSSAKARRPGCPRRGGRRLSAAADDDEEMALSDVHSTGTRTVVRGGGETTPCPAPHLGTMISDEGLRCITSWDGEGHSSPVADALDAWPDSPQDIRITVRTEVTSGSPIRPLPKLAPELYHITLPGPPTDGRRDVWPDTRPSSKQEATRPRHARSKSAFSNFSLMSR
ncbi:hypothetical protein PZA11_007357 [Diplocarpon coronariae]